jgi:hypothetical protein
MSFADDSRWTPTRLSGDAMSLGVVHPSRNADAAFRAEFL